MQADEGHQQRQRKHHRDHRRTGDRTHEQPDDRDHQDEAVQQVVMHRRQRMPDQGTAVVRGDDLHALGQDLVVELGHFPVDAVEHQRRVLAAAHQHQALHHFAVLVVGDRAAPRRRRELDAGHVAQGERAAVALLEHDGLDVLDRIDEADAADGQLLVAVAQEAAADVEVGLPDRCFQVAQAQAGGVQPGRIGLDLEFLEVASERHHVGHALHLAQHAGDVPLHFRAQLVEVGAIADHPEAVDLAERRGLRRQVRRDALGQIGLRHPLADQHARGKRVHAVVEDQGHQRQAEQALAAQQGHARGAVERALQRHGDLPLDFLGGVAGHLGDDLDLDVGDVGIGLDRRLQVSAHAEQGDDRGHDQDGDAPVHARFDDSVQHGGLRAVVRPGCRAARPPRPPPSRPRARRRARSPVRRARRRCAPVAHRNDRPRPARRPRAGCRP